MININIAAYKPGTIVRAKSARVSSEQTKPPSYYTEATLLEDMVKAYKFAQNQADRDMLKLTNGIGTARTRGEVIKDLKKSKMIEPHGKGKNTTIRVTEGGKFLSKIAPAPLKNVAMTAKWEILLGQVERSELGADTFIKVIDNFVCGIVDNVKKLKVQAR